MWQHRNTWQHDESNPENSRQHLELDQQIEYASSQGTASVRKEHHHLFTLPLSERKKQTLREKTDWLEFVTLAQQRARAHLRQQQETRRKFRAWARSGFQDTPPLAPPAGLKHKRSHSRSTSVRSFRRHADFVPAPSSTRAAPTLAPSSVTPRKRKRPPD
jgi:hypothetical protein